MLGGNSTLPRSVRLHWANRGKKSLFMPGFSALSRSYRYVIENTPVHSALLRHHVNVVRPSTRRAPHALGGAGPPAGRERLQRVFVRHPAKLRPRCENVQSVSVQRRGDLVVIDISANAFLHHMVREYCRVPHRSGVMAAGLRNGSMNSLRGVIARWLRKRRRPVDSTSLIFSIPAHFGLPATPLWASHHRFAARVDAVSHGFQASAHTVYRKLPVSGNPSTQAV